MSNKPIVRYRYRNQLFLERTLTGLSSVLSRSRRMLWYLEVLVLSARFQQRVQDPTFGVPGGTKARYSHRSKLWRQGVLPYLESLSSPIVSLEFGVATGTATRTWLTLFEGFTEWHGFDTFEGLPAPWKRGGVEVMAQGVFAPSDSASPYPAVSSYIEPVWHKGLIADTLADFERPNGQPLFVLIDVDLYEPTVDVLTWMARHGHVGDCIYFDEAFDPFNEGAALEQAMQQGMSFRVIGYTGSALAVVLT